MTSFSWTFLKLVTGKSREEHNYIDTTSRDKSETTLRISRLVFGQELKLIILILEISNVAITEQVSINYKIMETDNLPFPC